MATCSSTDTRCPMEFDGTTSCRTFHAVASVSERLTFNGQTGIEIGRSGPRLGQLVLLSSVSSSHCDGCCWLLVAGLMTRMYRTALQRQVEHP